MKTDKVKENRLRRQLQKSGYRLSKSRVKNINTDNHGGYVVTDIATNSLIWGSRWELSLEDVEDLMKA